MENIIPKQKTWYVKYQKDIHYNIIKTDDVFNHDNGTLAQPALRKNSKRFVVVDEYVLDAYEDKILSYFDSQKLECDVIPFASGEQNKTIDKFIQLTKSLDDFSIDRRSEPIIAIGGGVLTDVVGFVASCYRRGVPHIKVPTTLMGYVDAAVGIKTGIDFYGHKNRVGTFEPPKAVLLDKSFLKSLPKRHILNGVGEMVKLAVIKNAALFQLLDCYGNISIENKFQDENGQKILDFCISDMLEELEPNLFEDNLERCVDFGHTFSPILEMNDLTGLLHGEAVSIDIAFSAILSNVHSLLSDEDCNDVLALIKKLNLPWYHKNLYPKLLWDSLIERTQHRDGLQRLPLPTSIGKNVMVNDVSYDDIVKACDLLNNEHAKTCSSLATPNQVVNDEVHLQASYSLH